mmetsp:Transcript_25419/g.45112  ORF Transcript_25419/g.45112 Transcript_25419/m.45112 type:complete len:100 (-) Transcript_25419:70-369(-)
MEEPDSSPKVGQEGKTTVPVPASEKSQRSIMSGASGVDRYDFKGNPIKKGTKYRLSFKDDVHGEPITEVKEVQAYKSNYMGNDPYGSASAKQGCACIVM